MNIALFAAPSVMAPLQSLWRWLMPATAQDRPAHSGADQYASASATQSIANNTRYSRTELQNKSSISTRRPLRILRVMEAGQAPTHVGRMMISGRMADVCAELDRLAASEATLHH